VVHTILNIHNYYRQPGGEDQVFESESDLFEQRGHTVVRYQEHNERIKNGLTTAVTVTWNHRSFTRLRELARSTKPTVAHFHNTFPLISPAGYYAVRGLGIAVVQKLNNFRLLCPAATLLREGKVCEECIAHKSFSPAIRHGCYRASRPATISVAAMLAGHRLAGTWTRLVDVYIAQTEFARRKFIEGGLPADRIAVSPHMVSPDPGEGAGRGDYALFVGRLSEEKGIDVLLRAWARLSEVPLLVAGDGPLAKESWPRGVTRLGNQTREQVYALMRDARVLVVPSTWYEIGPLVVVEALACGLPVIASNLGSMAERVNHGVNGLLFRPNDAEDLARQVRRALQNPEALRLMRRAARREYERNYTADQNYQRLLGIYELAVERRRRTANHPVPRVPRTDLYAN
jgi:glycosyltransferase involved in cell wall biosynthesis